MIAYVLDRRRPFPIPRSQSDATALRPAPSYCVAQQKQQFTADFGRKCLVTIKTQFTALLVIAFLFTAASQPAAFAADEPAKTEAAPAAAAPPAGETPAAPAADAAAAPAAAPAGEKMKPIDRVKATEKGKLKNPYPYTPENIAEGKKYYLGNSCNGCHGGGGGGGMCPSLTNETWVYGSDDDTIFRLITLGSKELKANGYAPIAKETVTGPMPGYSEIIEDEEHLWKLILYVRSVFSGREEKKNWAH
jgi:mono/diheme cytochrome c family protein